MSQTPEEKEGLSQCWNPGLLALAAVRQCMSRSMPGLWEMFFQVCVREVPGLESDYRSPPCPLGPLWGTDCLCCLSPG